MVHTVALIQKDLSLTVRMYKRILNYRFAIYLQDDDRQVGIRVQCGQIKENTLTILRKWY